MDTLIISEKPSVAARLAIALGKDSFKALKSKENVRYYEIDTKDGKLYIVAAVGHIFTIRQMGGKSGYPVLDVEWAPSYQVSKASEYTKKYLDVIGAVAQKCGRFINACDYDIEGTVIGTNIIRMFGKGKLESAKRMKFSTTTTGDLLRSYGSLTSIDINNFYAGEARHMLDWLWGINISRALTRAVFGWSISRTNSLSMGRVQGPALAILAKREYEIEKFVSKPFWRVVASINGAEFLNKRGDIFNEKEAKGAHRETVDNQPGIIGGVESDDRQIYPYPPFDLTSLQLEASRALRMDPSRTLAVAQSLYERSFISYPRTSSQKLPPTLGLKGILGELAKTEHYGAYANALLRAGRTKPTEGKKEDEAHPAIFPTGVRPSNLTKEEEQVYDLIARRFLSCFAEAAVSKKAKVTAKFGNEIYIATGALLIKKGWLEIYPFIRMEEQQLPNFKNGEKVKASKVELKDLKTQPPKRYTKAGLISELEKRELGTKATRAAIIDTLFKRGYISGQSINVTKFGMSVFETLEKNCSMIVDDSTTRRLEEDMESISRGSKTEEEVISEGKEMLLEALKAFDANKDKISEAMRKSLQESTSRLGRCPKDGGDLVIRRSKAGKLFAACASYPKCTNTYSLPQFGKIEPTGRTCEHCHTPIIKVIMAGKRPFEMDLDPNCITKREWAKKEEEVKEIPKPIAAAKPHPKPEKKIEKAEKPPKKPKLKKRVRNGKDNRATQVQR